MPTRQQQPFRLARPTDWAKLKQEVLERENDRHAAYRYDYGRQVDDESREVRTHADWERILARTPNRRQLRQQPVETPEEHSTGVTSVATRVKNWAKSLWGKVRSALWG